MYKLHFPTHAKCFVQGTHRIALIYKTLNISLMPAAASLFHVLHTVHTHKRLYTQCDCCSFMCGKGQLQGAAVKN